MFPEVLTVCMILVTFLLICLFPFYPFLVFWQSASLVIHDYLCYNSIDILLQIVYVIACSIQSTPLNRETRLIGTLLLEPNHLHTR